MKSEHLVTASPRTLPVARDRKRPPYLAPTSPESLRAARRSQRLLDLLVASSMLVVLAIPMLVLALLVKLTSRGPALYRQERIGLGGKTFTILKFRTMRVDAEQQTGPVWAKQGDPRRTIVGKFVRRSSLDELPQLFNVLRGEMSVVGPRPERPCFVAEFAEKLPGYQQRHQVLPGITGWAQINGWRGDTSIEKRLECDLYYVNHRSLWFNLRILLLTPFKVLSGKNAC